MLVDICVHYNNKEYCISTEAGEPVSKALRQHRLLQLPCGGGGTCGKCLIYADSVPHIEEIKRLNAASIANGLRLACYTCASPGLRITIPQQSTARVLTAFCSSDYDFQPIVERREFDIESASLDNQVTDLKNIMAACGAAAHQLSLEQQARLPDFILMHKKGYALLHNNCLLGFSSENEHTLLSIDIGTTTVAAMLMDLKTRAVIDVHGELNDQAPFGADVISRIHNTIGQQDGIDNLQKIIVEQINRIKDTLLKKAAAGGKDITEPSLIAITGNTSMIHFLCGLPAEHISKAPFIPVTLDAMQLRSSELQITSQAPVFIMPGISAYVGADIVASLLAANAHNSTEPFLLVDFGTNAEIVLSDGERLYACSTAAGPCFEGATLSCGTVARPGAVDTIFKTPSDWSYTTIDNVPAQGICGSAVIDGIAVLLDSGDIDETGRFQDDGKFQASVCRINDELAFSITADVFLSQSDIRKIQLAKAAVRAGIETLIKQSGLQAEKIRHLYIAGGFGAALNPASAVRIGMIPKAMEGLVRVIGNAAGSGVVRYATEKDSFGAVKKLKDRTTYIELSVHADFTDEYVAQMVFPENEHLEEAVNY